MTKTRVCVTLNIGNSKLTLCGVSPHPGSRVSLTFAIFGQSEPPGLRVATRPSEMKVMTIASS
jgi:hypothetical protein